MVEYPFILAPPLSESTLTFYIFYIINNVCDRYQLPKPKLNPKLTAQPIGVIFIHFKKSIMDQLR